MGKKHSVKLTSIKGKALTSFQRSLVNNMARKVLIVGGLLTQRVEVYGCEAIGNYVNGTQKRAEAIQFVLNHYKTYPRNWQFWCAVFYKDEATGVTQYSSALFEPLYGTSKDIDRHLTPMVDQFVKDGDNVNLCSYGWIAIPSDEVEIDDAAEEAFVRLFEAKNCYDKEHGKNMLLARKLEWAAKA